MAAEDDDDAEDHSLIELAGDMLELILEDIRYAETAEFPDGTLLFNAAFEGVLSFALAEGWAVGLLLSTFLLAAGSEDLAVLSDEVLPELSLEDLVEGILIAAEEPTEGAFIDIAGLGNTLLALFEADAFGVWAPLTEAVISH